MTTPPITTDDLAARQALVRSALPEHLDRLTWGPERLAVHQRDALRALLRTALERSPFHARRLDGVDPDTFEVADLPRLPIMTKAEMMASFDEVVTDRRVSRDAVDDHLARTASDPHELEGCLVLASGGSSGERGTFVYPRAAAVDYLLGLLRPGIARMVALLGGLPPDPPVVAVVAAGSGVHATRAFPRLFGGDLLDPRSIDATRPLPSIIDQLHEIQPLILQGYPSVVRRLAEAQLAGHLDIHPLAVTTSSEPLSLDARARIGEAWGVGVSDQFGSSEGVLGASAPDATEIVLASDLAIVEPVDATGAPVAPGTPAAKVLVTNLFNPLQPLIRYEMTDAVTSVPPPAGGWPDAHLRVTVSGRSDDELRFGALVVHPLTIRTAMVKVAAVTEYQVHQTPRGIRISCVAAGDLDRRALARVLERQLEQAGLHDPEVAVEVVDAAQIERHHETGKTRRFIPLEG